MGVRGIPRDALVEIELVAMKGSFISEQLVRVGSWTSADPDFHQRGRSAESVSFTREVLSWPLWSVVDHSLSTETSTDSSTTATTVPAPVMENFTAAVSGSSCFTMSSRMHRCFSFGFMHIDIPYNSHSVSSKELQIAPFIHKELDIVQLLPENILSIRTYSSTRLDVDLGSKLGFSLGLHTPLSVLALESASLPVNSIIVQFILLDLPQLTTEAWIRNNG